MKESATFKILFLLYAFLSQDRCLFKLLQMLGSVLVSYFVASVKVKPGEREELVWKTGFFLFNLVLLGKCVKYS